MVWARLSGKIVFIGNGPIDRDWSTAVDACDCVFRFNFATADRAKCGTRTDYLVINSVGRPALSMLEKGLPWCAADAHIVFGRPLETHLEFYDPCGFARFLPSLVSTEMAMVRHFGLVNSARFAPADYAGVFRRLIDRDGRADFVMPSMGFATLDILLTRRPDLCVHLLGFTFEGWEGHAWAKERAIVEDYARAGRVIFWR